MAITTHTELYRSVGAVLIIRALAIDFSGIVQLLPTRVREGQSTVMVIEFWAKHRQKLVSLNRCTITQSIVFFGNQTIT